jgi:hypothetical protein
MGVRANTSGRISSQLLLSLVTHVDNQLLDRKAAVTFCRTSAVEYLLGGGGICGVAVLRKEAPAPLAVRSISA